jgi:hypothetical protein
MSNSTASSAASSPTHSVKQPSATPSASNVVFTIPNMNHTLNIKLTNGNLPSWRAQILAYVKVNDAYGFLDDTSQPPAQAIPNTSTTPGAPATMANPYYLVWCQLDQMLLSMLISTLTKPLIVHNVGSASAHQLWTTLVSMFASQAHSRVMQIHYRLATAKKVSSSITEYFQSFKAMCDNLAFAGQHLNDFESISYLLAGLGSEYDPLVTSITTRLDPLSLDEIYGHLLSQEMRIEHNLSSTKASLPMANFSARAPVLRGRGRNNYRGRGSSSGGRGRGSYFSQDTTALSRPICQLCGKIGHTAPRCYQRPDPALAELSPPAYSNAQAYYSSPSLPPEDNWYPDTTATHHMTNYLQNLNLSSKEYAGQDQIRIGNGLGLPILYSGSTSLTLSRHQFLLNQLLHVPHICKNLLLVHQFAFENSVFFEFQSSHFIIKDCKTRLPIHQGQLNNGLYQLFPSQVSSSTSQALVGERTTSHCWHKHLGHPALRIVNLVLSKFQLPVSTNKAQSPYPVCPQAKGHQLPFSHSTTTICNPLD